MYENVKLPSFFIYTFEVGKNVFSIDVIILRAYYTVSAFILIFGPAMYARDNNKLLLLKT